MRSRQLTLLAVAAAAAILAAIWAAQDRAPDSGAAGGGPLVPGLEAGVNDVTEVDIGTGAADALVTLERGEDGWTVAQKSGYPADIGKLRQLLLALAEATVLEQKTSDPESYAQLGVGDEIEDDATGGWIGIAGLAEPVRLVIGEKARGGSSTYARRGGEDTALLVSGNLDIDKQPIEWLRRDVLDVAAESVQSVTIAHPGGGTLEVTKATRGLPDFSVEDIPAGQQLKSAAEVNAVASALTGLRLEDVQPARDFAADESVRAIYRLFDGTVFTLDVAGQDERRLVHVDVAFDEELADAMAQASAAAEGAAEPAQGEGADESAGAEPLQTGDVEVSEPAAGAGAEPDADAQAAAADAEAARVAREAAREKAAMLESQLEPWLFEVSDYKYEQLTRTSEDLFESTVPQTTDED